MNNSNTQQPKKVKVTAILMSMMMMGNVAAGRQRHDMLTNGGRYGVQHKQLNQRQRRKLNRQMQRA